MKADEKAASARTGIILLISVAIGALLFSLDAMVDARWFYADRSFLELLITRVPPHELFIRSILFLVCVLAGGLVAWYVRRLDAEAAAARRSEQQFRRLASQAAGVECWIDADRRLQWISANVTELIGYTPEQCHAMERFPDAVLVPEDREAFVNDLATPTRPAGEREVRLVHAEGRTVWAGVLVSPLPDEEAGAHFRLSFRDLTSLKAAESRIGRLNAVLRGIRRVGIVLAREHDPHRMLEKVCTRLTGEQGYRAAWAVAFDESGEVEFVTSSGLAEPYQQTMAQWRSGELPDCARIAMKTDGPILVDAPEQVCEQCPLQEGVDDYAAMTCRLEHDGRVLGILTINFDRALLGDPMERMLFAELASDLAIALHAANRDVQRAASESRYRQLFDTTTGGVVVYEAVDGGEDFVVREFNEAGQRYTGRTGEQVIGRRLTEVFPKAEAIGVLDKMQRVYRTGEAGAMGPMYYEDHAASLWFRADISRLPSGEVVIYFDDLTEPRRVEKQMNLVRAAVDNVADAVLIVEFADPAGEPTVAYANAGFAALTGYGVDEILGQPATIIEGAMTDQKLGQIIDRKLRHGLTYSGRTVYYRKDGSDYVAELRVSAIHETDHDPDYYVIVHQDITDRQRVEHRLRLSEQRYRGVVEDQREMICRFKPDGRVTFANDAFARFAGREAARLIGRSAHELLGFQTLAELIERFRIHSSDPEMRQFETAATSGHRQRWYEWSPRTIHDEMEDMVEYQMVGRDITRQRLAEQSLRDSERQLRQIIDLVPHMIFARDRDGRYILANRELGEMVGIPAEQLMSGAYPDDRQPPALDDDDHRVLDTGQALFIPEERMSDAHGRTRFLQSSRIPLHLEGMSEPALLGVSVDITDRKKAEQALQDSETRFRTLFESMIEGAALHRMIFNERGEADDYVILEVNPSFESHTGITASEAVGRRGSEVYGGHPPLLDDYARVVRTGQPTRFEVYVGNLGRHFSVSAFWAGDDQFATVFQDITKRKSAEQSLRESEADLQAIFNSVAQAVTLVDERWRVRAFNSLASELAVRMFGAPMRRGDSIFNFVVDEHRDLFFERFSAALQAQPAIHELSIEMPNGEENWFEYRFQPVTDEKGEAWGVCLTTLPVTERKHAEQALRESEYRFRTIFEAAPIGVAVYQQDFAVQTNSQWRRILGHRAEAFHRTALPEFACEEDRPAVAAALRAIASGQRDRAQISVRLLHADQSLVHARASFAAIRDPNRHISFTLVMLEDVTDQHEADERLRQHEEEIAHISRMSTMGEMASGLAHELNQPLAAILNYSRGSLRRLRQAEASFDVAPILDRIGEQADRAGQIIRRLRNFVRKREPRHIELSINEVAREAVALCEPEARQRGVSIELQLRPDVSVVQGDPIQIEQVLINLIRNAMEAMEQSPTRVLSLSSANRGDSVRLTVYDRGHGLTEEQATKLFDPFYSTKAEGMGMGLAISRSIIEVHSGRLWAEPNEDGGASFHVELPAIEPMHLLSP